MEMRCSSWRRGHFSPAVHQRPANESARPAVITKIPAQRAEEEPDVLIQRVKLVPQRPPASEKVTADLAVHFENETGFWFVVGVIGSEEIGEEFPVLVYGVDRIAQKPGRTTKRAHRLAI